MICKGFITLFLACLVGTISLAEEQPKKYPLGDRPLTEEERAWLDARVVKINEIGPNDLSRARAMAELGDGPAPLSWPQGLPSAVDNSLLKFFPPIGNQGGLNSCAAVHACHYFASYSQAQDYNKDIRAGNYDDLMSPAFIYNTMNGNANRATSVPLSVARLCDIGACSRSLMPYDGSDYWTWPSEAAWVDALTNRMDTTYQVDMNTQAGIDAIKQRLANGDIAVTRFTVRNTFWSYPNDVNGINNKVLYWQTPGDVGGHGCTLVGYDDDRSYVDHRDGQTYYGAFLCANSWGLWGTYNSTGAGSRGFYWVAYRMFLEEEFGPDVYFNSDRRDYKPKVYAVTGMNHTRRGFLVHSGGIGPTGSPLYETPEALEYDDRDDAGLTDTDRVAVDLTDGVPFLQANGSNTLFVRTENRHFSIPGTVTSADFYVDLDRTGVYQVLSSTDPAYTIWAGQTLYAQVELVLAATGNVYVDASNTAGPWDGTSDNPYQTIQEGIDEATFRDTVIVRSGTYSGAGNRGLDFGGKIITVKSSRGPVETIIDCGAADRGFYFHSAETTESILDGFTITNGSATKYGGAIYCYSSSPLVKNCIITDNSAGERGGGICSRGYSEIVIVNCLIKNNTSSIDGGGIFCGKSEIDLRNCTITGNSATTAGGGVILVWGGNGTITDSIIWGNTAAEGHEIALKAVIRPSDLSVEFCDVEGGPVEAYVMDNCALDWGKFSNITSDPLFAAGPDGEYCLSQTASGQGSDSPCVDAGSDTAAGNGLDCHTTRTDRGYDTGAVDMGYHNPVLVTIHTVERLAGNVTIRWNAAPGKNYTCQWSADRESWTGVSVGAVSEWTDTAASGYDEKYYRVLEE